MRKYLKYSIVFNFIIVFIFTSTGYSTSSESLDQQSSVVASPIKTHLAFDPDDILNIIKEANQGDVDRQNQLIDQYQHIDPLVLKNITLATWPNLIPRVKESSKLLDLLQIIEFNLNPVDAKEVFEVYKNFEHSDNLLDRMDLAKIYFLGMGTESEMSKSIAIFRKLDIEKFAPAQYNFALMLSQIPRCRDECRRLLEASADEDYAYAEHYLGGVYSSAGRDDLTVKSFILHLSAAEKGHAGSAMKVANMYNQGDGTPINSQEALKYYKKAIKQGLSIPQYGLGFICPKDKIIPENLVAAFKLFQNGANQTNPYDQYNLALCYGAGYGVTGSATEAIRWFHEAALNGILEAQLKIYNTFKPKLCAPNDLERKVVSEKFDSLYCSIMTNITNILSPLIDQNNPDHLSRKIKNLGSLKLFEDYVAIEKILKEMINFKAFFSSPGFMVDYLENIIFFVPANDNDFVKGYQIPYHDKIYLFISYGYENVQNSRNFIETMTQLKEMETRINSQRNSYRNSILDSKDTEEFNNHDCFEEYKGNPDWDKIAQQYIEKVNNQKEKYHTNDVLFNDIRYMKAFDDIKQLHEDMMTLFFYDTSRRNHTLANQYSFLRN